MSLQVQYQRLAKTWMLIDDRSNMGHPTVGIVIDGRQCWDDRAELVSLLDRAGFSVNLDGQVVVKS